MAPQLDGRVFSRLQQFAALHGDFQEEVKELEAYLTTNKSDIFGLHHANVIKSIRSIRAKPLVEKIDAWLQSKNAPVAPTETESAPAAEQVPPAAEEVTPAAEEVTPAAEEGTTPAAAEEVTPPPTQEGTTETPAAATATETPEAAAAKAAATAEAAAARLAHAKKLLEALVLRGFVTPYKEQEKLPSFAAAPATAATGETAESAPPTPLVFKDGELLVPVAPEVADDASVVTVWQLVDGAVYAGVLKRKAGFLAPLTQGKDVYAVINKRLKSFTLFETDVGRHPIVHFAVSEDDASGPQVSVAFDKTHFVHGIKVWNDVASELLNAASKLERETIVHALVSVGLQYREEPRVDVAAIQSIYELKDVDIDGNEVTFDKYKGKVLLIVNVSSACGLTPINYPELVALDDKYRSLGLEVLGFPCNQFWGQEPGSHEEIKAFVAQYNVQFPLFAKGDVNGTDTRPVFAYLKAKQQGAGGDYIKWNFAKFLVDRNGRPVARFLPTDTPLSFEGEIVKLLSAEAEPEAVTTEAAAVAASEEAPAAAEEAAVATEEAASAAAAEPEVVVETAAVVAEAPVAAVEEEKAAPAPADAVVKTLSVETQPLPVEETKPAAEEPTPETKVEAEATPAATAAGEDATTKTEERSSAAPQVVQGFTPGNEPGAP